MENVQQAANAVAAESQQETAPATEGSAAATETAQETDVTKTQAFAKRLREKSASANDEFAASLKQTNPYTGKPITTAQEMRDYFAMREADEMGNDPFVTAQMRSMEAELAGYRAKEAEAALSTDPELAPYYDQFKDEYHEFMDFIAQQGQNVAPEAALRTIMAAHIGEISNAAAEDARKKALAGIDANRAASPGSLSGEPADVTPDWKNMSYADFDKYITKARRGELSKK